MGSCSSLLHKKFYLIIIKEHRLYYWKISCIIWRPIVVLEDQLYYWKSTVLLEDLLRCWKMNGRSKVLLENQLYWRQSTGLDGNYRSRKITARRWLHKYSEQNAVHLASPDTYIKCAIQTSVCPSDLFDYVPIIVSSWNFQELLPVTEVTSMQKVKVRGQRSRSQRSQPNFTVSGL